MKTADAGCWPIGTGRLRWHAWWTTILACLPNWCSGPTASSDIFRAAGSFRLSISGGIPTRNLTRRNRHQKGAPLTISRFLSCPNEGNSARRRLIGRAGFCANPTHGFDRQDTGQDDRRGISRLGRGGSPYVAACGRRAASDGACQPDPWCHTGGALQAYRELSRGAVELIVLANPGVVPRVQAEHNVRIPDLAMICSE